MVVAQGNQCFKFGNVKRDTKEDIRASSGAECI